MQDWSDKGYNARTRAFLRRAYAHVGVDITAWPDLAPASTDKGMSLWRKQVSERFHAYVRLVRKLHPAPAGQRTPTGFAHLSVPESNKAEGKDCALLAFTIGPWTSPKDIQRAAPYLPQYAQAAE